MNLQAIILRRFTKKSNVDSLESTFCEENTWGLSQENDNGIEYETKSDDVWELSKSEDEINIQNDDPNEKVIINYINILLYSYKKYY